MLDVVVDEGVVLRALDARLRDAEVERVVEQLLAVGADVEHHGEGARGVDAGGRGVDVELADGDLDAADAPVADAQDALGVGRDDQVDVLGPATAAQESALDAVGILDREVGAARSAVLVAVALDRLADGRGVDDRQHLGEVLAEQPEEQHLVAVVQRGEEDVLREVGGLCEVLLERATHLLLDGEHARREHARRGRDRRRSCAVKAVPLLMRGSLSTNRPRSDVSQTLSEAFQRVIGSCAAGCVVTCRA